MNIQDTRFRELLKEAGMNALMRQSCWADLVHRNFDDRMRVLNTKARIQRPGNAYEKLLALIVAEWFKL